MKSPCYLCVCVPLRPESRNSEARKEGRCSATARYTSSRGNEYTCNNRRTVGRIVLCVVRVVSNNIS
jgi:hypothetical protein